MTDLNRLPPLLLLLKIATALALYAAITLAVVAVFAKDPLGLVALPVAVISYALNRSI